jgi:hypothetical protein
MLSTTPITCNTCSPQLANNLALDGPTQDFVSPDTAGDSLLDAIRCSVWSGFSGECVLPSSEFEQAVAASMPPSCWMEVRRG